MPHTRTLASLRSEARSVCDQVNSTFVTDAEANVWINKAIKRLHGILVSADPTWHWETTAIATSAGTTEYALPSDFHSIIALDYVSGDERYPVEPYRFQERAFGTLALVDTWGFPRARYRILGNGQDGADARLVFDRDPGTGTYELHYVEVQADLAADGDDMDSVEGWDDYVIYDVASKMALKEQDLELAGVLSQNRELVARDIKARAAKRDQNRPGQIQDVRRRRSWRY